MPFLLTRIALPWARAQVHARAAPRLEGRVAPIEVKSGPSGRLRSLHRLLAAYPQSAPGQGLIFIPLYYAVTLFDRSNLEG